MTNKIKELVTQEMDNDYVSNFTVISDETLAIIQPLIEKIRANPNRHNFNYCDDGEHKYSLNNKLRDMR
jgi:hypothetical protein